MICRRADVLPIEAVVRGYLAGLGLEGIPGERHGLRHRAPGRPARERPPARTDLHAGDEGGAGRARREHQLRRWSSTSGLGARPASRPAGRGDPRALGSTASRRPWRRRGSCRHEVRVRRWREAGIRSLADTKFEIGLDRPTTGELILIDEALTPDSSRFWDAATYEPGRPAGELRQAVRPRLARDPAVGQDGAGPALPTTSSTAPAHATSRPTNGSPAPASSAISRRTSSPHEHVSGSRSTSRPSPASSIRRAARSRAAWAISGSRGSATSASAGAPS